MDPFSITVSCLTVITTVSTLAVKINTFVREVRDARGDLDAITKELGSLKTILELLFDDAQTSNGAGFPESLIRLIAGILTDCAEVLESIDASLVKHSGGEVKKGVKWSLSGKEDMNRLRSSLQAYKSALDIALLMVALSMTSEIKADTEALREDTSAIKDDTTQILKEIAKLQAKLPREAQSQRNDHFTLFRYLDNMTTYAATVGDVSDNESDSAIDMESHEEQSASGDRVQSMAWSSFSAPSLPNFPEDLGERLDLPFLDTFDASRGILREEKGKETAVEDYPPSYSSLERRPSTTTSEESNERTNSTEKGLLNSFSHMNNKEAVTSGVSGFKSLSSNERGLRGRFPSRDNPTQESAPSFYAAKTSPAENILRRKKESIEGEGLGLKPTTPRNSTQKPKDDPHHSTAGPSEPPTPPSTRFSPIILENGKFYMLKDNAKKVPISDKNIIIEVVKKYRSFLPGESVNFNSVFLLGGGYAGSMKIRKTQLALDKNGYYILDKEGHILRSARTKAYTTRQVRSGGVKTGVVLCFVDEMDGAIESLSWMKAVRKGSIPMDVKLSEMVDQSHLRLRFSVGEI